MPSARYRVRIGGRKVAIDKVSPKDRPLMRRLRDAITRIAELREAGELEDEQYFESIELARDYARMALEAIQEQLAFEFDALERFGKE